MLIGQTHLKANTLLYLFVMVAVAYEEKVVFLSDLDSFVGIRSTQPTC